MRLWGGAVASTSASDSSSVAEPPGFSEGLTLYSDVSLKFTDGLTLCSDHSPIFSEDDGEPSWGAVGGFRGRAAAKAAPRPRRTTAPARDGRDRRSAAAPRPRRYRCDDDDDEADVVERRRGRAGRYRRNRALPAGVEKARSEWSGLGGDRSQEIHRLFGGEYSGTGCYIVVTAGREDSRGLGNPMTEPFPRRPRVLGSPRSVALAKEGVPPEWEPGCGAPRRRRPVGRERQPGATGHVTSGPGHRTRCGGVPRVTGWALAAGSPKARVVSPPAEGAPGLVGEQAAAHAVVSPAEGPPPAPGRGP